MLPMTTADSRKMMSTPHEQRIFLIKITVAHEQERVKKNRMRVDTKAFTASTGNQGCDGGSALERSFQETRMKCWSARNFWNSGLLTRS